jgi:hypothetical protein
MDRPPDNRYRPLRIQYTGACYQVTYRGNDRKELFKMMEVEDSSLTNVYYLPVYFSARDFK